MPIESPLKNHVAEARLFTRRVFVIAGVIFILIVLLIARLVYLQIIKHDNYTTLSQNNQLNLIPEAPNRGLIYDRNGVLLAENIPVFSLDIIPNRVSNIDKTIRELQKIIKISPEEIDEFKKTLREHRKYEPIPLKIKLTNAELARFYVNQYRFPGVTINARLQRYYPSGKAMASVVGYVGRINAQELEHIDKVNYSATNYIGKSGIEKYYENILHGTVGYDVDEMDANGRVVRTIKHILPTPGTNIYLSIDSKLQLAAEKALGKNLGSVVAIQPSTGEILALASNPSYDPNLFVQGISGKDYQTLQNSPDKPLFNRALRGQYPLASTIKPFLAIDGLDSNAITPDYTIYDPGWFRLTGTHHIYLDWKSHDYVNVKKALIVSCDTFFYGLSVKIGIKGIDKILNEFGFGNYTYVDINGEMPGLIPSPAWKLKKTGEPWYTGDTVISSIGQGFMLSTPLQLANATAGIAMHGKRFRPRLLYQYKRPDGSTFKQAPIPDLPVILKHSNVWDIVIKAMEQVITSPQGTGFGFGRNPPYTIAAKTGTGQVYKPKRFAHIPTYQVPEKYRSHSLFIAFAPVKKPQIAVSVVVEHSPGAAALVARKVMDEYLITEHHLAKHLKTVAGKS